MTHITTVKDYLLTLQETLCSSIATLDGTPFKEEVWGTDGFGGKTCTITGSLFEKGAVNFSHVTGTNLPSAATLKNPKLSGSMFNALGVSVILHPMNPFVPTTHANVRFFMAQKEKAAPFWWFGGGYDLTPYYGFIEDCYHWHHTAKEACDPFGEDLYPTFKAWCDSYFYLKHRQEARGIGGIFFDDFNKNNFDFSFDFMRSVGDHFWKAYEPIVKRRQHLSYGQREKNFQLYRRGRYVEFNLVYDRGTLFGLQSGGRIESILASLPPEVHWHYNWHPEKDSREEALYTEFLPPRDWLK